MMNQGSPMKDACGPCLSPKQLKQQQEKKIKDLKSTIKFLCENGGYQDYAQRVIGDLCIMLVRLEGLK